MGAQCKEFKDTERETSMHAKMVEQFNQLQESCKKTFGRFCNFGLMMRNCWEVYGFEVWTLIKNDFVCLKYHKRPHVPDDNNLL